MIGMFPTFENYLSQAISSFMKNQVAKFLYLTLAYHILNSQESNQKESPSNYPLKMKQAKNKMERKVRNVEARQKEAKRIIQTMKLHLQLQVMMKVQKAGRQRKENNPKKHQLKINEKQLKPNGKSFQICSRTKNHLIAYSKTMSFWKVVRK